MLAWRDNRAQASGETRARRAVFVPGLTEHFALSYDGLNRLTSITGPLAESFSLDGASNITFRTDPEMVQGIIAGGHPALTRSQEGAEDTILRKLEWFRRGGETSDRQWQDILSILAVTRGQLDEEHLDRWARELKVTDLLERARRTVADL